MDIYLDDFTPEDGFGRSKTFDINRLKSYPIAQKSAIDLEVFDCIDNASWCKEGGTGAVTIGNDFIWLSGIFQTVKASKGIPIDMDVLSDARVVLRQHNLIAKSNERDRRPTKETIIPLLAQAVQRQSNATADAGYYVVPDLQRSQDF